MFINKTIIFLYIYKNAQQPKMFLEYASVVNIFFLYGIHIVIMTISIIEGHPSSVTSVSWEVVVARLIFSLARVY